MSHVKTKVAAADNETTGLPAICTNGHLFTPGWAVAIGPGTTVTVKDSGGSPCPECRAAWRFIDGTYTAVEQGLNSVRVVRAVRHMSPDELRALAARFKCASEEEQIAEVRKNASLRDVLGKLSPDMAIQVITLIVRVVLAVAFGAHW